MEHAATAGIPGLLEVNAPLIEEQAAYRGLRDAGGADRVAARAFRAASVLLAVSAEVAAWLRSEEHTSELQSRLHLVCRLLLEKKKKLQLEPTGSITAT